jgi:predicted nucleotide-binding protein
MEKARIFISYAHNDKTYFDIFLSNLKSQCDWDIWTDRNIEIGKDWFESIRQSMVQTDVAILLISPDFISSAFIKENEFKKFSELNEMITTR